MFFVLRLLSYCKSEIFNDRSFADGFVLLYVDRCFVFTHQVYSPGAGQSHCLSSRASQRRGSLGLDRSLDDVLSRRKEKNEVIRHNRHNDQTIIEEHETFSHNLLKQSLFAWRLLA